MITLKLHINRNFVRATKRPGCLEHRVALLAQAKQKRRGSRSAAFAGQTYLRRLQLILEFMSYLCGHPVEEG